MLSSAVGINHRRKTKTLNNDSLRLSAAAVVLFAIIQLSWVEVAHCQPFDGTTVDPSEVPVDNPALVEYLTGVVYGRMSNLTTQFVNRNLAKAADFCINDPDLEWDRAFNYSSNLTFVSNCIIKTKGDVTRRICTAKEISLYFNSFNLSSEINSIPPNMNCNRTFWPAGCEPGWACSVNSNVQVDLTNYQVLPDRKQDCQACCEGFFCPSGLTCMIPCPLGSYCPLAQLNTNTGACDPYSYQLPLGQTNHTCGGANIWADVGSSEAIFCPAGSYCHTNINQRPCTKGNYCPMGSTAEKRCFKLASCDPSTASQNIHAYGVMLIAALTTLLLIVYNFSDQIITIRERRNAQARDAAARTVKANAQARERWKSAKAAIKKHANDVQTQVSQRFSRRKIATGDEMTHILNETEGSLEHDEISTVYPGIFIASDQASTSSEVKKTEVRREPKDEDLYENSANFSIEAEDKSVKTKKEKEKTIHSHSQIFRYAYAQLEKEKAQQQQQNKNLTFSGVIAMATNTDVRKRPVIEISFRDLTVTLKGQKRHILRSVTGKIKRGRITAVMGPSGAGKTTFLSALAGKAVGCKISGLILINGKAESVHSYKKIVGFVPQDDIVHGNLTVEENLWFSTRCRLSSDLPKADKVLTVERVIESLGLQAVRNSLVGTVEKRGISGGQKKRVNVGLELVMEPSLLFLDEPTSGLDSSSSQLLLRALRREALEGVNICMVVHQPSYTLFKSFDELVLLAKGGLTVYHGSVNKVEEYFSSLGIDVPERVNPPDYYIDVLEGMVKPRTGTIASYEELPVRWMYHNGYPIPPDMQKYSGALGPIPAGVTTISEEDDDISFGDKEALSFAGDVWVDVKSNIERQRDMLRHNFLRSKDLSMRKTPNVLLQYKYYLGRLGKQQLRESQMLAVDLFILLIAGACLGSLSKSRDEQFGAPGYINSIIAVSLLCKIAALRSFSLDKLQYWRESASGISSLAHFVAKDTIDQFKTIIKPAVYLSMFFFFNNPRSSFWDNYLVLLCLVYCVTGIAYLLAIFLQPGPSQLLAVLLPVVLTLIVTQSSNNELFKNIQDLCYPKWALEAFVIANAERYYGVWIITRCAALRQRGYNTHDWNLSLAKLILNGLAARIIAFIGMLVFQRK